MKKIVLSLIYVTVSFFGVAQETVLPAQQHRGSTVITNATIHTGKGDVIENGTIVITDGKIAAVGKNVTVPANATTVNAQGKHVYPGLILPTSTLGLVEISAVRASNDARELGDFNPNVRSLVAY